MHTPIRPGSDEPIASGMAFQCDIIPTPMRTGWTVNCEDTVVVADDALRGKLRAGFPELWERIVARQRFMRDELGIAIADELLPLSAMPAYLPPCWLAPARVLTRG